MFRVKFWINKFTSRKALRFWVIFFGVISVLEWCLIGGKDNAFLEFINNNPMFGAIAFILISGLAVTVIWFLKSAIELEFLHQKLTTRYLTKLLQSLPHALSSKPENFDKFVKDISMRDYIRYITYIESDELIRLITKLFDERFRSELNAQERHERGEAVLKLSQEVMIAARKEVFPDTNLKPKEMRIMIDNS